MHCNPNSNRQVLLNRLRTMRPGTSFRWFENHQPYHAAKVLNLRISTYKLNGTGFIVTKLGQRHD